MQERWVKLGKGRPFFIKGKKDQKLRGTEK